MKGWISIHRKIEENELWLSEPFTKGQAWVDLVMLANHQTTIIWKRGIKIELKRGEVGWSEERLAKRWQWSRGKVRRFLKHLKTVQQIEQHKSHTLSRIYIINYDKYQRNGTTDGTTDSTNDNNVNNDNKLSEQSSEHTTMGIRAYNENEHSDDLPAIDADSGERQPTKEEAAALKRKGHAEKKKKLVDWLIEHQQRDRQRFSRTKQLSALNQLIEMGVKPPEIKQTLLELESEPYWQGRAEKPDFKTVVSRIQSKS